MEVKMDDMQRGDVHQDNGEKFMHNTFWLQDRICVTFDVSEKTLNAEELLSTGKRQPLKENFPTIFNLMTSQLGVLNGQIADMKVNLDFFPSDDLPIPPGVYVFPEKIDPQAGIVEAKIVSFVKLEGNDPVQPGLILRVVNRINQYLQGQQKPGGQQGTTGAASASPDLSGENPQVSISSSAPAYLCGATNGATPDHLVEGCPLTPAIPVPADTICSSSPGLWPITLPKIPGELKAMTGDGVTVFVLDTLPKRGQIRRAAEAAEENNLLLLDVANNVTFTYPEMLDGLDDPGALQAGTGKDIHGRLIGFRMPDHGLFVAGIIRDLAPDANVECIRVLNDFCAGSVQTLIGALNSIYNRMLPIDPDTQKVGDLYNARTKSPKPVVINLSLVIPDDNEVLNEVKKAGVDTSQFSLKMAREGLLAVIQSLVNLGVVFVASAGNEGDQRFKPMSNVRPNALYPAAFAYNGLNPHHERINIVGVVDKDANVTKYSCYPGKGGFASYGGDVPPKEDIKHGDDKHMTTVDVSKLDAPIGLYTSLFYPALSIDDPEFRYPAPNANGWAYWVGTSFATPIVSAVAARALELNLKNPPAVGPIGIPPVPIVTSAATERIQWTNLDISAAS